MSELKALLVAWLIVLAIGALLLVYRRARARRRGREHAARSLRIAQEMIENLNRRTLEQENGRPMTTESDDAKRQAEVLAEIDKLGIRYPGERAPPPKDEAEALEQEKRALEIRYAPVFNRKVGEPPAPPKLTVIEGGKAKDQP